MNKLDLEPTEDELVKSLNDDSTGCNAEISGFLRLLANVGDLNSIAINAQWGSGKTFFVKQVKYIIDHIGELDDILGKLRIGESNKNTLSNLNVAYFDAWESDGDVDPLYSIVNSLVEATWFESHEKEINLVANSVNTIVKILSGVDLSWLSTGLDLDESPKALKKKLSNHLDSLTKNNEKVIIFVDELDRCNPVYAVKLLERIKHYLNRPNIVFVFSTDISQLQHTVKNNYGYGFDGLHYLDRFFELVITLSNPDMEKYINSIPVMDEVKNLFGNRDNNYYRMFCLELIQRYNFSLRTVNHFILKAHSASWYYVSKVNDQGRMSDVSYGIYLFTILALVAIDLNNHDDFVETINGYSIDKLRSVLSESNQFEQYSSLVDSKENFLDRICNVFDVDKQNELDYSEIRSNIIQAVGLYSPNTRLD